MNIDPMSVRPTRSSQDLHFKLARLLFLVPFLGMLSTQSALGQGFKTSRLNPPSAYTASALGLNTSQAVVGQYEDENTGATLGFLYAGGKYTVLNPPGSANTFARGNGINDSETVVGDFFGTDNFYHGYIYVKGTYTQWDIDLGKVTTSLFGINNSGDCVGSWVPTTTFVEEGFISKGCNSNSVTSFYAPGTGTDTTFAYSINSSDEVVGQYLDTSNVNHGFYRNPTTGKFTTIDYPGASNTVCFGINDAGEITGYYINSAGEFYGFTDIKGVFATTDFAGTYGINNKKAYVGFYYGVDGLASGYLVVPQTFKLTEVKIPNDQQGSLYGINNAGVSVGNYVASNGKAHGMMVSAAGKVTNIDDKKGVSTICFGINSTNEIVGDYFDTAGNPHGFQYAAGKFKDIPGPAGALSDDVTGINNAGEIVGDFYDSTGTHHGFVLKGSKYTQLDVPGANATFGGGINTAGLVTLYWVDPAGYVQSSLYNGKKYTSINVPGVASTHADSINTAGDIVFSMYDPYGVGHGALKKGNAYYLFDYPKGSQTGAFGINDSGLMVGSYIPAGKTKPQPFKGTLTP